MGKGGLAAFGRYIFSKLIIKRLAMVKLSHLKPGDIVHVLDESVEREGVVVGIDRDEDLVCIDNGIQEFWYPRANIRLLPLTEERLVNTLGFEKEEGTNGSVKYKKGAFRV